MLPELTREELAAGMDAVVFEILNEAGIHGPPVDAMDLARRLGITVATDEFQEGRARYVRLRGGHPSQLRPTILLRPFDRRERQHWAVAHEIGEHAAYRVFAAWGADPRETPPRAREETANCLAGRLLVPTAWFAPDGLLSGLKIPLLNTCSVFSLSRQNLFQSTRIESEVVVSHQLATSCDDTSLILIKISGGCLTTIAAKTCAIVACRRKS